jgi:DNA-damage-inducible protein D
MRKKYEVEMTTPEQLAIKFVLTEVSSCDTPTSLEVLQRCFLAGYKAAQELHDGYPEANEFGEEKIFSARQIYRQCGYTKWVNFHGVVLRATQLIKNLQAEGVIRKTKTKIRAGKGAVHEVLDYELCPKAYKLVRELCRSFKTDKCYSVRNETALLSLLRKYCTLKGIEFEPQCKVETFVYDCRIGSTLVEFDEPHHTSFRQQQRDSKKDGAARRHGYKLMRFGLYADFVDMLFAIESLSENGGEVLNQMGTTDESRITIRGAGSNSTEHQASNREVRGALTRAGIYPEKLPAAEDLKKVASRLKAEEKQLPKHSKKLKKG